MLLIFLTFFNMYRIFVYGASNNVVLTASIWEILMNKIKLIIVLFIGIALFAGNECPAQTRISGSLSGTLGPDTYIVEGDVSVDQDSALTIMPGTVFQNDSGIVWEISGRLIAQGTETDSILWTWHTASANTRWRGIRFQSTASDSCVFDYCIVEHCYHNFMSFFGGGIYLQEGTLTIDHSRISECEGWPDGGGIYAWFSQLHVRNSIITDNSAPVEGNGGGIYFLDCDSSSVYNCIVARNAATSI